MTRAPRTPPYEPWPSGGPGCSGCWRNVALTLALAIAAAVVIAQAVL